MFDLTSTTLQPNFQLEAVLTPTQRDCYKARAQALRSRFPWSPTLLPIWNVTLIHLSANVPGKVAYFSSIKNLMENRLTRTSPQMFLERSLIYAPEELKAAWACEVLGHTLPEVEFVPNTDPNGWYEVYDNGPNSCMAGSSLVKQYAHPNNNLALAYTKKGHHITHRTIVNTKRKTYLRIYGTEDVGYFVTALNKLGYRHSFDTLQDELIKTSYVLCMYCNNDVLAGPYLDGHHLQLRLRNRDEGTICGIGEDLCSNDEPHCGCGDYIDDDT